MSSINRFNFNPNATAFTPVAQRDAAPAAPVANQVLQAQLPIAPLIQQNLQAQVSAEPIAQPPIARPVASVAQPVLQPAPGEASGAAAVPKKAWGKAHTANAGQASQVHNSLAQAVAGASGAVPTAAAVAGAAGFGPVGPVSSRLCDQPNLRTRLQRFVDRGCPQAGRNQYQALNSRLQGAQAGVGAAVTLHITPVQELCEHALEGRIVCLAFRSHGADRYFVPAQAYANNRSCPAVWELSISRSSGEAFHEYTKLLDSFSNRKQTCPDISSADWQAVLKEVDRIGPLTDLIRVENGTQTLRVPKLSK